jgi:hypothetical protein
MEANEVMGAGLLKELDEPERQMEDLELLCAQELDAGGFDIEKPKPSRSAQVVVYHRPRRRCNLLHRRHLA